MAATQYIARDMSTGKYVAYTAERMNDLLDADKASDYAITRTYSQLMSRDGALHFGYITDDSQAETHYGYIS